MNAQGNTQHISSVERELHVASGWLFLFLNIALYIATILLFVFALIDMTTLPHDAPLTGQSLFAMIASIVLLIAAIIMTNGFFSLQPGQARVCVLFGKYVGTVREGGFHWANPFFAHTLGSARTPSHTLNAAHAEKEENATSTIASKISLRARTHNGERIKVNDKMGNPIEIATVVVWRVADTAKAVFDVDDYESYVSMQVETALRHVASIYAYDHMEDDDSTSSTITLRSDIEEVSEALKTELDRKLAVAGVAVEDARLTHLAYAPEIAQAMLRRQQADAVIAARKKIVEGAVSMVDMALTQLSQDGIVDFDEDRKAVMASNLMVVLCGESEAQPVVNTGSLYQ